MNPILHLRTSPHINAPVNTTTIMRNVVWALLPATGFAIYSFGLSALLILLVSITSCLLTEWLAGRASGQAGSLRDWSAVITGLLFALTLPPNLPLWMVALGGVVSIGIGKFLFGGLGANPFNPALVGRAFLMAAFPAAMTTWSAPVTDGRFISLPSSLLTPPLLQPAYDGLSGATPLGAMKFAGEPTALLDLMLGYTGGSLGETSAVLILLGGLYLAWRGMLDYRIPCSIFTTVIVLASLLHLWRGDTYPEPLFHLFSGGLMLGAVFMATDMVTSPVNARAVLIYGIFIGTVVIVIRQWGGLPEGVMYAILLGNAIAPILDRLTRPKPFGTLAEAPT